MYVRPPNNTTERIKVPENYRGNAFGASGEYTDMPSPIRLPRSEYDLPPEEYREQNPLRANTPASTRDAALTKDSGLSQRDDNISNIEKSPIDQPYATEKAVVTHSPQVAADSPSAPSILSSLLHQTNSSAHFPFGHGIGTEELLILGIMLLVFTHGSESGEYDNTLILLLALLLFSG